MAETIITNGIVLKEQTVNEKDRLLTVLTSNMGLIRCYANGAKSIKNKNASATDMFCYSKLSIVKSKSGFYTIREATPLEVFFNLRMDLISLSLAQYISEIATELAPKDDNASELLSVVLNSLYLIANNRKNRRIVKATAELRIACLAGYMPSIVACDNCGEYESDSMYFNPVTGKLWCENCKSNAEKGSLNVGLGIITAMRHICYSEPKKIFSFTLPDDSLIGLSNLTELYLRHLSGKKFKTLDFYNQLEVI